MNISDIEQVDEFLAGRLSEEALDEFELHLLEDSALQQYVTEQVALRDALKSESQLLLSDPPASLLQRLHQFLTAPVWAYAASLALVFLIPMALLPESNLDQPVTAQQVVWRNVEFTRSADIPKIYAPAYTALMLSIDAYGMDVEEADIRLMLDGEEVFMLKDIFADEQALLHVVLSPLSPASYTIEIIKPQGEIVTTQLVVE